MDIGKQRRVIEVEPEPVQVPRPTPPEKPAITPQKTPEPEREPTHTE